MRTGSSLAVLFVTVMIDLIGFGVIIPLMPLYVRCLGQGEALAGILFASYSLMQFFCSPLLGRLSDRIGRKPVLIISLLGNAAAMVVFGLAEAYPWLLLARVIGGASTANVSVAQAYIADISSPADRAKRMGLIGAAFGIGFVVGPLIGGELAPLGLHAPPFFVALLSLLNAASAVLFLREPKERKPRPRMGLRDSLRVLKGTRALGVLVLVLFVQVAAFSMLEVSFSFFVSDRMGASAELTQLSEALRAQCAIEEIPSFKTVGRVFGFIGIISVIVQGGLIGPLNRRWGEVGLVRRGLLAVAVGMLMLPAISVDGLPAIDQYISHSSWLVLCWGAFLGLVAVIAFGQGITSPALSALMSKRAPDEHQGLVLGVAQSAGALARTLGPLFAGMAYQALGSGFPFWIGGSLMLGAWLVALRGLAQPQNEPHP